MHQFVVIDHFEVTFITSKTPNDRSVCSIDLGDSAEIEPVDNKVAWEVLLNAVDMTVAG